MSVIFALYYYLTTPGVQALPVPLNDARRRRLVMTSIIVEPSGTSYGVTQSLFPHALGLQFTQTFHPDEKWHAALLCRIKIALITLLAPELVILWAIRQ